MGNAGAVLNRLARPLKPDRLEIVQGGDSGMIDEKSQQVPLCDMSNQCQ